MKYFISDYSLGAHPKVMQALMDTNLVNTDGYGADAYTEECAEMIKRLVGKPDAAVHFFINGTASNTITCCAPLKPYEGIITPRTGHIYVHETGSVELNGHRIFAAPTDDGKLTPDGIEAMMALYEDEHTVIPRVVCITNPTENGGVYTKAELQALRESCDKNELYLYIDGARLGTALMWPGADLTLRDIADLADAFYIGGTKTGALYGEALVITNPVFDDRIKYRVRRNCALLGKARTMAIQLKALFEDETGGDDITKSLYARLSKHENEMAIKLAKGIQDKGYELWLPHQTNQVFIIVNKEKIAELEKEYLFYTWCGYDDERSVIRLVTNWNTSGQDVEEILAAM